MLSTSGMLERRASAVTSYYVELVFDTGGPFSEGAEDHFDQIAAAFTGLSDVDGDVGVDSAAGRVELCMTLEAADRQEALRLAFIAARTAVHTAGGATHGWDRLLDELLESDNYRSSITPSSLV